MQNKSFIILCLILLGTVLLFVTGCTFSLHNISTHGTATDLVDEEQEASPKTQLTIPSNFKPW